jgi:polygalacturonase
MHFLLKFLIPLLATSVIAAESGTPPEINPRDHGAKGDGVTYDTEALQKTIDLCGGRGGIVNLTPGTYLTAQLTLRPRMTLRLQKGAVLLGGTHPEDYPALMPERTSATCNRRSLLFADRADGLVIEGEGVIDGRCRKVMMSGKEAERPSLIRIFSSKDVIVRDITLRNPRMWTQVYAECTNLLLDHVTVVAPPDCPNLDGMDICDCHDVVIRNCEVFSEDDCICLKSNGQMGLKNILVENNRVLSYRANGIKLGTATVGPVSGLTIRNNVVEFTKYGGLCIESVDGSHVSDVRVSNLVLRRTSQPVFIRLANRVGKRDSDGNAPPVGSIDGVVLDGVRAIGTQTLTKPSFTITGIPSAHVKNVTLRNCRFEMPGGVSAIPASPPEKEGYPQSNIFGETPACGLYMRHVDGISLERVEIGVLAADARPFIVQEDSAATLSDCRDLGVISPEILPTLPDPQTTGNP